MFNLSFKIRQVSDANHAWITPETVYGTNVTITMYTFCFNPGVPMTLEDVATTIENDGSIRRIRINHITARGHYLARQDFVKYNVADLMKDGETFTCDYLPVCCGTCICTVL